MSAAHCGPAQPVSAPSTSSASHHHGHQAPPPQLTPLGAFPSVHTPGRGFPPLLHKADTACTVFMSSTSWTCQLLQLYSRHSKVLTHWIMWVCLQYRRECTFKGRSFRRHCITYVNACIRLALPFETRRYHIRGVSYTCTHMYTHTHTHTHTHTSSTVVQSGLSDALFN